MFKKRLLNKFIGFLMCCVFVFCNVAIPTQSMAYDGIRDDPDGCNVPEDPTKVRENNPCYIVNFNNETNKCEVGNLKFSAMLPLNRDIDWELFPVPGNSYCTAFVVIHVAALYAASKLGAMACASTGISAAIEAGNIIPGIGPQSLITQTLLGANCATALGQCAFSAGVLCGSVGGCCAAAISYAAILAASVAELAIIFAIADSFFKETNVCGWKWRGWEKETISTTEENSRGKKWQVSKGPYRKCIENIFKPGLHKTSAQYGGSVNDIGVVPAYTSCGDSEDPKSIKSKSYREYTFGGMEYEDNGSNACKNPWTNEERKRILGYESQNQRYYFSGSGEGSVPNFACYRFLQKPESDPTGENSRSAYDCCVNRSQEVLCIERPQFGCTGSLCNNIKYKFCEANSKCDIEGVKFETFYGKSSSNYLCAKSYSVCPYNQTVAGGSETAKYDEDPLYSDVKLNFCQHLNHCWKLPLQPTIRSSEFTGNFISSACYDMRGDSQNSLEYNAGQLPISTRHFTAPFVQCFKETMENVFLNRAGRDICTNSSYNSLPNCGGAANILYAKGTYLPSDQSFFKKIQNNYRMVLKMVLTFSIIMLGISTLLAVPKLHLEKKVIMTFIFKLSLVMYFALGDAWQLSFANAVLNISSIMSDITFRPNLYNGDYTKLDGCQFPRYNSESTNQRDYTKQSYPAGKEYLRIWDVLDCKIIKALGFGGEISVPNIFLIIIAGFFSSALGVVIFVATFIFGFILISIAIRAMHIFLISTSAIVIFLFISPITITMVMFERTKKVFESWWKQLLGYSLQPMILFIYISIFLTAMDSILIGSAKYSGAKVQISPDQRYVGMTSVNDQEAIDNYGYISEKTVDCSVGNASWDSIICIFNLTKFGKLSGFDTIGIGIPTITNITKEKLETITKSALIMFIFLNFIDTMTTFASKLVGGSEINSNWNVKTTRMLKGAHNLMRGIQKRGMRAMLKHGASIARLGSNLMKGGAELSNASKNISNARNQAKNNPADSGDGNDGDNPSPASASDPASPAGPSGPPSPAGPSGPASPAVPSGPSGAGAGVAPGGDHQGSDSGGKAAPSGDHVTRDSIGGTGELGTRGDHVARDNDSGAESGGATAASSSRSADEGDAPRNDSSTSSSGRSGGDEAKDGISNPDARGDDKGASKNEQDHAERSGEDSKISIDGDDKKDNSPSGDFADRSDSPQPSIQGSPASPALKKPDALDDKNKDTSPDQGDKDDGGYDADKEDYADKEGDEFLSDDSAEGDDGVGEDEGKAEGDAKSDDKSTAKKSEQKSSKFNPAEKAKRGKKPKAGGGGSSGGGGSAGGGGSSTESAEGRGLTDGGSSFISEQPTVKGFSSSDTESNMGSGEKIGIGNLSDGIKIGLGGDILGGMGKGLGVKSAGDALQTIIAQSNKTPSDSSLQSLTQSSSSGGNKRINGKMTGDQIMAVINKMKANGPQGSGLGGGSQDKSYSNISSSFPALRGQGTARETSPLTPEVLKTDSTNQTKDESSKFMFPAIAGSVESALNFQTSQTVNQQVKEIVKAQGVGGNSSKVSTKVSASSGGFSSGSSPLDYLGVLGDFMAKGIEPATKAVSGAVDGLFGIDSAKSKNSNISPSKSDRSSSALQNYQSASPQDFSSQVRRVIENRRSPSSIGTFQDPYQPASNQFDSSSSYSLDTKISQKPERFSPAKERGREAWGMPETIVSDTPEMPVSQEPVKAEVQITQPQRPENWAKKTDIRGARTRSIKETEGIEEVLEIEEFEVDDGDDKKQ